MITQLARESLLRGLQFVNALCLLLLGKGANRKDCRFMVKEIFGNSLLGDVKVFDKFGLLMSLAKSLGRSS